MRVACVADLHGSLPRIPDCDVLAIAGDLAPDFGSPWDDYVVMQARQREWLAREYAAWERTVPAEYIVMTPGNHDWFVSLPAECRTRFLVDELFSFRGRRMWFTPWIPPIGCWNYMLPRSQRRFRFRQMPEGLDVLVSHSPPHMCLDRNWAGDACGCPELRAVIQERPPKHAVFGHIHEGRRHGRKSRLGTTMIHNVAFQGYERKPILVLEL